MRNRWRSLLVGGVCLGLTGVLLSTLWPRDIEAQGGLTPAPARRAGEGAGPFNRMVIRNVMIIDGTGAPPYGPMNVIVSGNRIASIQGAGTPGVQAPAVPAAPAGRQ